MQIYKEENDKLKMILNELTKENEALKIQESQTDKRQIEMGGENSNQDRLIPALQRKLQSQESEIEILRQQVADTLNQLKVQKESLSQQIQEHSQTIDEQEDQVKILKQELSKMSKMQEKYKAQDQQQSILNFAQQIQSMSSQQ